MLAMKSFREHQSHTSYDKVMDYIYERLQSNASSSAKRFWFFLHVDNVVYNDIEMSQFFYVLESHSSIKSSIHPPA